MAEQIYNTKIVERLDRATNGRVKLVYGRDPFVFREDLLNTANQHGITLGLLERRGGGTIMALGTYACDYRLYCVGNSDAWAKEFSEPLSITRETARVLVAYLRNIRPLIVSSFPSALTAVHDSECEGHYCDVSLIIQPEKCSL